MTTRPNPLFDDTKPLRIAFLVYRGNPRCGGQGVYTRHLTRELANLGHEVTVFSGQPYPELARDVELVRMPSLDLYRDSDPFRHPRARELSSPIDLLELATMYSGGFPEPRTFSLRARAQLVCRLGDFDVVHDDQCLGTGLLGMQKDGWPVIASIHHPVTIDRDLDIEHTDRARDRRALQRWYRFSKMQQRIARRLDRIITVSESSRHDIVQKMGVSDDRIAVVAAGVDTAIYRPMPDVRRIPNRIMTTASADIPLKGLIPLLEAVAKLRTEISDAHLIVIGKLRDDSPARRCIERLGLERAVEFISGEPDEALAQHYARASVAVVPSLYEGFSLPAVEAMACGVPLVTTTGGALPEVVGENGGCALTVEPGDPSALAVALFSVLSDGELSASLGLSGRDRVVRRFTWSKTAEGTIEQYRVLLAGHTRC